MRKLTSAALLTFLTLLTACSMVSLVYDAAPWYVRERVDDYFDLTGTQARQLDSDIDTVFAWHRREELPQYVAFLDRAVERFADGLTRQEIEDLLVEVREARRRLALQALPLAGTFLLSVSEEQLDYYKEAVQEKIEERREDLELPVDERHEQDFEDLLDSLEDWFGDFDDTQLARLRVLSDALPDNREYWLGERERRTDELIALLRTRPSRDAINEYLYNWLVDWRFENDTQREISERSFRRWQSAMLEIDQLLTPRQRAHAIERLNGYRQDFFVLSSQTEESLSPSSRHR